MEQKVRCKFIVLQSPLAESMPMYARDGQPGPLGLNVAKT